MIVLTFNQANELSQALESILKQDFAHNAYEIVVGEDASLDQTADVLKQYAKQYPHILPIFNAENQGIVKNYAQCLKKCSGKYVMVCAGDDYWLPGKMRFQVDFMERNPEIAMIFGNWNCLEEGRVRTIPFVARETFSELLLLGNNICAPSTCYRRTLGEDFLKETQFETQNWGLEDYPLWLFLAQKGKIRYIPKNFCVYRVLENSASHFKNNDAKRIMQEKNNWAIRLFFSKQYAPEYLNLLQAARDDFLFHSAWNYLWNQGFHPQIQQLAQTYGATLWSLLKKIVLLYWSRYPILWNGLMKMKNKLKKIKKVRSRPCLK